MLDQLTRTPLARAMPSDWLRTTFCCFLCMSWHLHVLAPRVCILVVRAHQDRSVRNEGHSPTQYDHREGSEGRERHFRRSERFFFPRRLLSSAMKPPTSRVVRRRQTWPSASQVRPGSAWSGWARCDRQRTMYTRGSPAAHPELSRALRSGALPRARVHGSL